jgi:SAM-dependent methyltransferase
MAQDSSRPEFWETRYRGNVTPWDQHGVPMRLAEYAANVSPAGTPSVLIPGCGAAYEAKYLHECGWRVRAIDFSAAAVEAGRSILGEHAALVEQADFFELAADPPGFDVIYERAFLCALPPRSWPDYARHMAALIRPGGVLAGFFFLEPTTKGPPFGIAEPALHALLGGEFDLIDDRSVGDSIPIFEGRERWQVWRRKPSR